MSAHQHVVSDDPVVEDLLLGILDLVREAGGWFAPELRLHAAAGQISIDRVTGEGPLLHIPEPLWVRVDAFEWGNLDGQLTVLGVPDDVGDLELAMAFLQAGLTNQCDRLRWLQASHPALAPDLESATIEAMRAFLPGWRAREHSVVDVLWATRCFRMPMSRETAPQRVLVPLVDLLNHHGEGASGALIDQSFHVDTRQPCGTAECALDYGMGRDALEMAAIYGFADASATRAHSAPMELHVDDTAVRVDAVVRSSSGAPLAGEVSVTDNGIVLRGLTFARGSLTDLAAKMAEQTAISMTMASDVLNAVLVENRRLTDALIATCASQRTPAASTIMGAAAVHREILLRSARVDELI